MTEERERKRLKKLLKPSILPPPKDLTDIEKEQWETINSFEEKAWSSSNKGLTTGFAGIDMALEGLQTGFHIIGGDSNIGKTSFLSQLAGNVATLNSDSYVIDFSLDDPMLDKMSRMIATLQKVLINAVKNPKRYKKYPKMLERRAAGIKQLRQMVNCYKCYDQNHSTDIEKIEETVKRHIVELKQAGENRKVVVFIDNFHDLTTTAKEAQGSDKNKYDYLAQYVSDMATRLDIPIVCTAEFKKLNGYRRPTVDDIRELTY